MPADVNPNRIEVLDDAMAEILRRKSPSERLAIAHGMWRSAREIIRNVVLSQHSDRPEENIQREVARRLSHGAI